MEFGSAFQGFIIMIICILIGLFFSFAGVTIDAMHDSFTKAKLYDVPPQWDASPQVFSFINLYFFECYIIPLIGVGIFIYTLIPKQQYDQYGGFNDFGGFQ